MTRSARQVTCEEALRFLSTYIDGELEPLEHSEIEQHLQRCRSCWSRAEFERRLKEQLAALREESVPVSLQARVGDLLMEFTGDREAH